MLLCFGDKHYDSDTYFKPQPNQCRIISYLLHNVRLWVWQSTLNICVWKSHRQISQIKANDNFVSECAYMEPCFKNTRLSTIGAVASPINIGQTLQISVSVSSESDAFCVKATISTQLSWIRLEMFRNRTRLSRWLIFVGGHCASLCLCCYGWLFSNFAVFRRDWFHIFWRQKQVKKSQRCLWVCVRSRWIKAAWG